MEDKLTQEITIASLDRKNHVQVEGGKQTPKASPVKASPAKSDYMRGNAMEGEKPM